MIHKIFSLTLIVSAIFLFSACNPLNNPKVGLPNTASPVPESSLTASLSADLTTTKLRADYELVATQEGQIALDLLASENTLETTDYGTAGQFVTSINGLASSNEYYWAFYVNGAYAEKGASQTKLKKGDIIKFVYEAVTPAK